MLKNALAAFAALTLGITVQGSSLASTFSGFSETSDLFYDNPATLDYDPSFVGGSVFDQAFLVDISFTPDLETGSLLLTDSSFATVLDGTLLETALNVDNGAADDSFSMIFNLATGPAAYAIATFTGDLDGLGFTNFFSDGVFYLDGNLKIVGAEQNSTAVVPLPAGLPLLLTGVGGLVLFRRKQVLKSR